MVCAAGHCVRYVDDVMPSDGGGDAGTCDAPSACVRAEECPAGLLCVNARCAPASSLGRPERNRTPRVEGSARDGRHRTRPWTRSTAPLLTSAALLSAAEALASPPCDGPSVDVDAHVTPLWQREIVEVIQRMRRLPDIDRCARVAVTPVGPDLRVEVTLSDGRVTLRAVRDPAELRAWIDPLLIVPPRLDPPAAAPPAAPVTPVAPVAPSARHRAGRASGSRSTRTRAGVRGGALRRDGPHRGRVAGDWVLGASASMGDGSYSFSIGGEVGRRFHARRRLARPPGHRSPHAGARERGAANGEAPSMARGRRGCARRGTSTPTWPRTPGSRSRATPLGRAPADAGRSARGHGHGRRRLGVTMRPAPRPPPPARRANPTTPSSSAPRRRPRRKRPRDPLRPAPRLRAALPRPLHAPRRRRPRAGDLPRGRRARGELRRPPLVTPVARRHRRPPPPAPQPRVGALRPRRRAALRRRPRSPAPRPTAPSTAARTPPASSGPSRRSPRRAAWCW